MSRFPDFGKELGRPFEVAEQCYDCTEFYDGCNGRAEKGQIRCLDYLRLPDVMPGTYGQVFPPSRMKGRKTPPLDRRDAPRQTGGRGSTGRSAEPSAANLKAKPRAERQGLAPSPAANHGLDGERLCVCGALLRKRARCCDSCRLKRRQETMLRRPSRKSSCGPVDADSGLPTIAAGTVSSPRRIAAHN